MAERDSLKKIEKEISVCKSCKLCLKRKKTVPGEGNSKADIFFIGEGPGKNEDLEGRPFVGAAGKFLEEMLMAIGLTRGDVFIGNVVKCRPPMNRDPLEEEIKTCVDFLYRQLEVVNPKLVVTLGRFSLKIFMPQESISSVHGRLKRISFKNILHPLHKLGPIYILPLYHPAAALYRSSMRQILMNDFKNIPKILSTIDLSVPGSPLTTGRQSTSMQDRKNHPVK